MEFFINFGKEKDKQKHIYYDKHTNRQRLNFNIVVSQKINNQKQYGYLKAETWNNDLINKLQEGVKYKLKDFYLRFFYAKNNDLVWVIVVKSIETVSITPIDLGEVNELINQLPDTPQENNQNVDDFILDI